MIKDDFQKAKEILELIEEIKFERQRSGSNIVEIESMQDELKLKVADYFGDTKLGQAATDLLNKKNNL